MLWIFTERNSGLLSSKRGMWDARRLLSIPNPLHQIILCQTLEDNWPKLEAFFLKSKLSLSTPKIAKGSNRRAVNPASTLKQLPEERVLRSTSSRILLHADVSTGIPQ